MKGFVFGEERVHPFGDGERGFKAIGALDVPGGEDELGEDGALDGGVGAEFVFVSGGEGGEFLMIFGGEHDGLFCVEAELGGVGCGVGLAFGGAGAGGELGVGLIGFDLRGRGQFVSGSFSKCEGRLIPCGRAALLAILVWHGFGSGQEKIG